MVMNELCYIFCYSLLCEVVYSMQLNICLKQLYCFIVEVIEKLYVWQLEICYVDLVFYYEQVGVFDKICEYLCKVVDYVCGNY